MKLIWKTGNYKSKTCWVLYSEGYCKHIEYLFHGLTSVPIISSMLISADAGINLLDTYYVLGTTQALYIPEVTAKSKGLDQGWEKISVDPRLQSERAKATCCTTGSGGDCVNPGRAIPSGANHGCWATREETGSGLFDPLPFRDV